jgi:hypothetical protein
MESKVTFWSLVAMDGRWDIGMGSVERVGFIA